MIVLVVGLLLFLGIHSAKIIAADGRQALIERIGDGPWKGIYTLVSAVGLVLIVWGYGLARQDPVVLWFSPQWLKHVAVALNLVAFVLLAAYIVPAGRMKARLGHPMLLSVKVWAFAHLLANGTLADVLLFGGFLVWALADFRSNRQRERAAGTVRAAGPARNDAIAVALGVVMWAIIVWGLHEWVIGVDPFV